MQDFLQAPRLQALESQALSTQQENDKKRFLIALANEIINNLSEVTVANLSDGININNFDEVKASLRNELSKANKPITDILNRLNLSTQEQTKFLQDVQTKAENEIDNDVQTVVIKRIKDKVEVTNLSDIVIPSDVSVNNLLSLEQKLDELINKVAALKLSVNLPAPQVNVQPPEVNVNVPQAQINAPEVNIDEVLKSLDRNLLKLRQNNKSNPVFVRMTDLDRMLSKLDDIREASKNVMLGFPGAIRIQNATGGMVDFNNLSVATSDDATHQAQFDYSGGTTVIYAGFAPRGLATSASGWLLQKFTYDGNNNVTQKQIAYNSWDNRASASYA